MGGRALKSVTTKRCDRKEFDIVYNDILNQIKTNFIKSAIPMFYSNKETFGDVDILICTDGFNQNLNTFIQNTFKPNEIFHNGNCYSFDYKNIQIDFITVSNEDFETHLHYLHFNDLGNFLGRIAQSFGFKYGDRGLWYEHYYKGINLGKIILSKNQREIYTFLDLSYDRFEEGFNDLEDIFKFISTSKCFNYEKFYLSSLSKINRERNKKRKSYMSFLDWIENNVNETTSKPLVEKLSINEINELFPSVNLLEQIKVLEEDYDRKLLIKSKFNGSLVIEKYGFKEKELSLKLNNFKEYINTNFNVGYDNFILNNDIENICLEFENSYL